MDFMHNSWVDRACFVVELDFSHKKIFFSVPIDSIATYSPNTPPCLWQLGCDPDYPLGIIYSRGIVESKSYGYVQLIEIFAIIFP